MDSGDFPPRCPLERALLMPPTEVNDMLRLRSIIWASCLALTMLAACGDETDENLPSQTETIDQRLDNRGEPTGPATDGYPAELSGDGKSYCAVGRPNLCAPARAAGVACQD